ncbi:MAG: disulfide bond formation protein B [Chloroflexi bacterium]|nr:disulfide bond formation protein B [Chloroflexota bacterium]
MNGNNRTTQVSLYIALAAAVIAMVGSLYFSEVAGFIPCKLCWYQRILMYPLTVILLMIIIRYLDEDAPYFVLPFSLLGIGASTYHFLLQKTDIFNSHAVCTAGAPCTTTWINWFGFITIPFLALVAFLIITIAMMVVLTSGDVTTEEDIEVVEHLAPEELAAEEV